jgi:hypothetical protein
VKSMVGLFFVTIVTLPYNYRTFARIIPFGSTRSLEEKVPC